MAPLLRLALLVTALTFAFFAAQAYAEDDYEGPEMGQSMDPDSQTVESEDVDDLKGQSEDPDDLVVGSEDPEEMMRDSENPDGMVAESEDLDDQAGRSYELGDLPRDSGSESLADPMPELVGKPEAPTFNDSPEVHAAWRAAEAAERNMEASNDIYANMIDKDYPRGERRVQIIEERRAAFERVNETRRRYKELRGE